MLDLVLCLWLYNMTANEHCVRHVAIQAVIRQICFNTRSARLPTCIAEGKGLGSGGLGVGGWGSGVGVGGWGGGGRGNERLKG